MEEFEQIYVLESLPEEKIRASPKTLAELEKMNAKSINQNPIPWKQKQENAINIASLNCMNLNHNHEEIVHDPTLMESTLLAVSETWLDEKTKLYLNGYNVHFNSVGSGKGLALYYKPGTFTPSADIKQEKMQISKLESGELEVIQVYRSEQGNLSELLEHLKNLITPGMTTVVCGDFNICSMSNKNNKVSQWLDRN